MYASALSVKRAMKRITQVSSKQRCHEPVEYIVKSMNAVLRGWSEYFKHTASSRRLRKVQNHANRRLRRYIMRKKNSRKSGYKELPDEKLHKVYGLINIGANRVQYRWAESP